MLIQMTIILQLGEGIVWAVPTLGNMAAPLYSWMLRRHRYGCLYHQGIIEILKRNT